MRLSAFAFCVASLVACRKSNVEIAPEADAAPVAVIETATIVIDVRDESDPPKVTRGDDAGPSPLAEVRASASTHWGHVVRGMDFGKSRSGVSKFFISAGDRRTRSFELPRATVGTVPMPTAEIAVTRDGTIYRNGEKLASATDLARVVGDASRTRELVRGDIDVETSKMLDVIIELQRLGHEFAFSIRPMVEPR